MHVCRKKLYIDEENKINVTSCLWLSETQNAKTRIQAMVTMHITTKSTETLNKPIHRPVL